jgi:hypothetical protein
MSVAQHVALALRKARLQERIAQQRDQLAVCVEPFEKPLALVDKVLHAGRVIQQQPWIAGVAVFGLVVLRRRHFWRWIGRGWTLWRSWRIGRRWLHEHGYL